MIGATHRTRVVPRGAAGGFYYVAECSCGWVQAGTCKSRGWARKYADDHYYLEALEAERRAQP